eukprot:m.249433 g.249433  ORF g.249433 m.249433 type:complete len:384 (+) comp15428_c0_seq15:894-2045(+)
MGMLMKMARKKRKRRVRKKKQKKTKKKKQQLLVLKRACTLSVSMANHPNFGRLKRKARLCALLMGRLEALGSLLPSLMPHLKLLKRTWLRRSLKRKAKGTRWLAQPALVPRVETKRLTAKRVHATWKNHASCPFFLISENKLVLLAVPRCWAGHSYLKVKNGPLVALVNAPCPSLSSSTLLKSQTTPLWTSTDGKVWCSCSCALPQIAVTPGNQTIPLQSFVASWRHPKLGQCAQQVRRWMQAFERERRLLTGKLNQMCLTLRNTTSSLEAQSIWTRMMMTTLKEEKSLVAIQAGFKVWSTQTASNAVDRCTICFKLTVSKTSRSCLAIVELATSPNVQTTPTCFVLDGPVHSRDLSFVFGALNCCSSVLYILPAMPRSSQSG